MSPNHDDLSIGIIQNTLSQHKQMMHTKYGIIDIGIFGSYVRGEAGDESDIDIIVDIQKSYKTFDNYMELKFFLEGLFHRKIDLVIKDAVKDRLREHILTETLYV